VPGVFGSENPCISPGGDFFDNEWEFLHLWFHLPRGLSLENVKHQSAKRLWAPPVSLVSAIPSWLENTGARAFQHHFENRNWEKEFQKLNEELRRTPVFFNRTLLPSHRVRPTLLADGLTRPAAADPSTAFFAQPATNLESFALLSENLLKRRKKRVRTLKLLNTLRTAGGNKAFDGFIVESLPVLPPEL
jgi:hypothetical protein